MFDVGVCERRLFIEPQNMIQAIFLDCDKDNDGALNAEEYASFLKTIGTWGKHNVRAASLWLLRRCLLNFSKVACTHKSVTLV